MHVNGRHKTKTMKIFVGNLDSDTSEYELYNLFAEYGTVAGISLPRDKEHLLRGFGYVLMPNKAEAENAIRNLNKKMFGQQFISVSESMHVGQFSETLVI